MGGTLGGSWKHPGKSGQVPEKSLFLAESEKSLAKGQKMLGRPQRDPLGPLQGWDTSGRSNAGGVNLEVAHASALWRIAEKKCGGEGAAF